MRPPEAADPWAGNVFRRFHARVMLAMIRRPAVGRARAIEHREEDQDVAHDRVQSNRGMRERAVIADRHADSADPRQCDRNERDCPSRPWKRDEADNRQHVNQADVEKRRDRAFGGLPPRGFPWFGAEAGHNYRTGWNTHEGAFLPLTALRT